LEMNHKDHEGAGEYGCKGAGVQGSKGAKVHGSLTELISEESMGWD
jgi:hypothetical protein